MNNEQQELLDEAHKNYWSNAKHNNLDCLVKQEEGSFLVEMRFYYKEEFINKCKTDTEFSERWGLKIEERELSLEERYKLVGIFGKEKLPGQPYYTDEQQHSLLDELAPTKLITIAYNDKRIESYE
jgi:hypothetical protein